MYLQLFFLFGFRIDDIDFSQTPLSKFEGKDGQVTFMEYYKTNYGIELTDVNQPLLINRYEIFFFAYENAEKKPIYF